MNTIDTGRRKLIVVATGLGVNFKKEGILSLGPATHSATSPDGLPFPS